MSDCDKLLEHGMRDEFVSVSQSDLKSAATRIFRMTDEQITKTSRESTTEGRLAAIIESLPLQGDVEHAAASARITAVRRKLRDDRSAVLSKSDLTLVRSLTFNDNVLEAYVRCLGLEFGLLLDAEIQEGDPELILVRASYRAPAPEVPDVQTIESIALVNGKNASGSGAGPIHEGGKLSMVPVEQLFRRPNVHKPFVICVTLKEGRGSQTAFVPLVPPPPIGRITPPPPKKVKITITTTTSTEGVATTSGEDGTPGSKSPVWVSILGGKGCVTNFGLNRPGYNDRVKGAIATYQLEHDDLGALKQAVFSIGKKENGKVGDWHCAGGTITIDQDVYTFGGFWLGDEKLRDGTQNPRTVSKPLRRS